MNVDLSLKVPWGYGTQYKTLGEVQRILLEHFHPEFVRRLIPWLYSKGGDVGVGGHWRADGTQPDEDGFAPEGESFHQNQKYSDGFIGATAVDIVRKDGPDGNHYHDPVSWDDVPTQGSKKATKWGLHANVGYPGKKGAEPWHIQPVEIDGHASWLRAGSPAPVVGYPLPGEVNPTPHPEPVPSNSYTVKVGDGWSTVAGKLGLPRRKATYERLASEQLGGRMVLWPGDVLYVAVTPPAPDPEPGPPVLSVPIPNTPPPIGVVNGTPDRVRWLQRVLNDLSAQIGLKSKLSEDGTYGTKTVAAVKALQRWVGAEPDGSYGNRTRVALARRLGVIPPVARCTLPDAPLYAGASGSGVVALQSFLASHGWYRLRVDGNYGPRTREAVQRFQQRLRTEGFYSKNIDGQYGPLTRDGGCDWQQTR